MCSNNRTLSAFQKENNLIFLPPSSLLSLFCFSQMRPGPSQIIEPHRWSGTSNFQSVNEALYGQLKTYSSIKLWSHNQAQSSVFPSHSWSGLRPHTVWYSGEYLRVYPWNKRNNASAELSKNMNDASMKITPMTAHKTSYSFRALPLYGLAILINKPRHRQINASARPHVGFRERQRSRRPDYNTKSLSSRLCIANDDFNAFVLTSSNINNVYEDILYFCLDFGWDQLN